MFDTTTLAERLSEAGADARFLPAFLRIKVAADHLGVSLSTMYDLCYDGTVESVKVRGSRRVVTASLLAYVDSLCSAA